ncbi:MAG: 2-C-methyl-D-erythritol 4-phosphate cytidylyltransferase, partial [Methylocystis sp.]
MGAASDHPSIAILVVAGGRGARAGDGPPKQYRSIAGKTLLARTLEGLRAAAPEAALKVVIHRDDVDQYEASAAQLSTSDQARLLPPAFGGATRQDSVRNGLEALAAEGAPDIVLIHDAARPFADAALVARAINSAAIHGAAAPGVALADTIKEIDDARVV